MSLRPCPFRRESQLASGLKGALGVAGDYQMELGVVALDRCRRRPQAGAPAALTNFVGIDEVIGSLLALGTFDGHGSGNTANIESASASLAFNPFAEFPGKVSPGGLFVRVERFIGCEEKRPGAQPQS
jgi:hypothetical protein